MTDRERLLVALLSDDDVEYEHRGNVTVFDVVAMLYELGAEYQLHASAPRLASIA